MSACPRCGTEMKGSVVMLNVGGRCERLALPGTCPDRECNEAREAEVIQRAIDAGVIDP